VKISLKLILVGTLIMAIPLVMVASFSVTKARTGLIANTNEEVTKLTHEIAQELDLSIQGEIKLLLSMANDPDIIVGDEPTGNLDSATAEKMFQLLCGLNDAGKTVLFVTHDRELARRARRIVTICDGRIVAG